MSFIVAWEASFARENQWQVLAPRKYESLAGATLDRLPRNGHDASVLDGVVIRRLREQCSGVKHGKREEQHPAATCDPPRRHESAPHPEDKGGVH